MADDLQRAAFDASLQARDLLSASTLLQSRDYDPMAESAQIKKEIPKYGEIMEARQKLQAKAMGAAQMISAQYQQAAMASGMPPAQPGAPVGPDGQPVGPDGQPVGPDGQPIPQEGGEGQPMDQESAVGAVSSPLYNGMMGFDTQDFASHMFNQIRGLPPQQQQESLVSLKQQFPGIAEVVATMLATGGKGGGAETGVDMRPAPDKRPPRRGNGSV
jgi:hypothetical protein